jgi:hypothetical protein
VVRMETALVTNVGGAQTVHLPRAVHIAVAPSQFGKRVKQLFWSP